MIAASSALHYAAAAATSVLAGALRLTLGPGSLGSNVANDVLFT
ncbi:MAG TPA: hypothetical protein VHA09_06265 [Nitrososphaera sp.]|nr:hypothetical protein [Nitrososphaera sp.]